MIATLKKRADFVRIAKNGKSWVTPSFILQCDAQPSSDISTTRVGYTATKKIGSAVKRNLAKRRLRATSKEYIPHLITDSPHDYVLIARRELLTYPYDQLCRDLKWALKRIHQNREDS
ncbi:MAG: ribonuclease P protein component [Alphaproteobacteria bacterium]